MDSKQDQIESEKFVLAEEAEKTMSLQIWFRIALKLRQILGPELMEQIGWKYLKTGDYHWRIYHRERHSMYQHHVNYVVNFFSDKTGRLLDVGCGEGLILSLLSSQMSLACYGIDNSKLAIAFAHEHGVMNSECIDLFDYGEGDYDFVYAGDILEHLDHPDLALSKMKDFLKPGGFLYVAIPVQGERPKWGDKYVLTVDGVLEMIGKELKITHHETRQAWLKNYFLAQKEMLPEIVPQMEKEIKDG